MPTILVADDSPAQRELIAGLLKENGFSVATAIDGAEALDKLKSLVQLGESNPPDFYRNFRD